MVAVLDDFITWAKENRASLTASRYEEFCQGFVKATLDGVKVSTLAVSRLTPRPVTEWLSTQQWWGPTTRRSAITALQRGFNSAVKNRGLDRNPLRGMDKPTARKRTQALTPDELEALLTHCSPEFRGRAVELAMPSPPQVEEGDEVAVAGDVANGTLIARAYRNRSTGTYRKWDHGFWGPFLGPIWVTPLVFIFMLGLTRPLELALGSVCIGAFFASACGRWPRCVPGRRAGPRRR